MNTVALAAAAKLAIATAPALTPPYSAGVPDYTVRCKPGEPVTVKASIPRGQSVAVDGQPPATGSLEQDVNLAPGQAFTFTVNGSATHNVRCLPSDMPRWRVQRRGRPVAQWFVFAPTLKQFGPLGAPYSVIADRHGVPVWWMRAEGATPVDARFLPDGTFTWARLGGGFSQTYWDHVALDGTKLAPFNTVGIGADHHDMQVLPNGDVLMIADTARDHVDLRRYGGPRDATVIDASVQELAPDGRLVWQWSTKDHIRLGETTAWGYERRSSRCARWRRRASRCRRSRRSSIRRSPRGWSSTRSTSGEDLYEEGRRRYDRALVRRPRLESRRPTGGVRRR